MNEPQFRATDPAAKIGGIALSVAAAVGAISLAILAYILAFPAPADGGYGTNDHPTYATDEG
jgi:hypothetical protein